MWHEARRSERKVHDLMDAARKRAQRRAVFLAKRRGDPQQSLQVAGSRCRIHRDDALYQATQDQQGLIPWNGQENVLIDRFDGRALLDFIREPDSRGFRVQEKTEEEEELEEFVNFERYRDLIKHRRKGFTDEEGLQHVDHELEARLSAPFAFDRSYPVQPPANKGSYTQVGFSYEDDGKDEPQLLESDVDDEDDDDEKDSTSDDSDNEGMDLIAKEFGVKRFSWLVYMDRKAREEEKRQKEVVKGDPSMRKLSRKERRKASQMEREREREAARVIGSRKSHHDPYREPRRSPTYEAYSRSRMRSRSRSCSRSPSYSRRHDRGAYYDIGHQSRSRTSKIEYITEFGGSGDMDDQKLEGVSPPRSPPFQADVPNRPSTGRILEALHNDPASSVSLGQEKSTKVLKASSVSTSSALAKLSKPTAIGASVKPQQSEKKETPQERLKRIMSKQLNKQIKKDTVVEMAKKREQERQRQEKLAETNRISRYRCRSRSRSYSRSPPRHRCSRSSGQSHSRSPRRYYSRSRSPR
ncbi:CLK4-associating serine/arginine rich protein isoform X2 [Amborella trichopoda]|nr:CLK4-associating serine/arginine rich protein isoform X2 [Amborella trichopoda]|eukprot:XP_011621326.1 CLK4-associating serine/arginine rich protein isoform X2 [Amborella trichopoda]